MTTRRIDPLSGSDALIRELGRAIDRDAEVPLGVQLAWALRARIQAGGARVGDRLPGLRETAEATGLNVNTVRAVYQRLDQEGLIDSRQGSGTFVSSAAPAPANAPAIAASAAREARETGVDPREVAAALYVLADTRPAGAGRAHLASARRRELREQIGALERAIGELESEHPGIAPISTPAPRAGGPALLGADELERVRSALVRRLASVQGAIDGRPLAEAEPVRARRERKVAPRRVAAPRAKATPKPAAGSPRAAEPGSSRSSSKRSARRAHTVRPAAAET
jgi:DNA-binding transcriptional regulator YhcF (GntR family)